MIIYINIYIYIYIYINAFALFVGLEFIDQPSRQPCMSRLLINVTSLIHFLLNSYFENPTVILYVLYVLNMRAIVGLHFYTFSHTH